MSSRGQTLLARVNWYLQSSLKHITKLITGNESYYRGGRYRQVSLYNFKHIIQENNECTRFEIVLRWILQYPTNGNSILVHVMAWCYQVKRYLSQCSPQIYVAIWRPCATTNQSKNVAELFVVCVETWIAKGILCMLKTTFSKALGIQFE